MPVMKLVKRRPAADLTTQSMSSSFFVTVMIYSTSNLGATLLRPSKTHGSQVIDETEKAL